ncbi:hypothetical protein V6N13_044571 [Hibiscus sabdariffa]|uniref:Uncharacterized protein n=1 Tax=Hibiscus sabdariffa TaxID=183260 RepID=A0ABR2RIM9_9ROSI
MAESSKKGGNKAKVKCFSLGDLVFAKVKERLAMIRQQRTEAAKKREEEKAGSIRCTSVRRKRNYELY